SVVHVRVARPERLVDPGGIERQQRRDCRHAQRIRHQRRSLEAKDPASRREQRCAAEVRTAESTAGERQTETHVERTEAIARPAEPVRVTVSMVMMSMPVTGQSPFSMPGTAIPPLILVVSLGGPIVTARERADPGIALAGVVGISRGRQGHSGNGNECKLKAAHGIPPWIDLSRVARTCTDDRSGTWGGSRGRPVSNCLHYRTRRTG